MRVHTREKNLEHLEHLEQRSMNTGFAPILSL